MKLKKYVQIVSPLLIVVALVLIGFGIYQIIFTNDLDENNFIGSPKDEWIVCGIFGIVLGTLQVLLSCGMFIAPTGHTAVKTPIFFLGGFVLIFLGELSLLIASLVFDIGDSGKSGKGLIATLIISLIIILGAIGWLVYKMTKSKMFKLAASRATDVA